MSRYRLRRTKNKYRNVTATSQSESQFRSWKLNRIVNNSQYRHKYATRSKNSNDSISMTDCSSARRQNENNEDDDNDDDDDEERRHEIIASPEGSQASRLRRTSSDTSITCLGIFRKIPQYVDLVNNKEEPKKIERIKFPSDLF